MVDGFGRRLPAAVRTRAREKILHATRVARRLAEDTGEWWAGGPVTLSARPAADPGFIEVVATTDPLPTVGEWWLHANNALQDLRAALDQLHHAIWVAVVQTEPGRIYFPLFMAGPDFRKWRKAHEEAGFPADLLDRYRSVQPYVTRDPELHALVELTNDEKHRNGVFAAVDLAELRFGLTAQLESDAAAAAEASAAGSRETEVVHPVLDEPEVVLLRRAWPHEVVPQFSDLDYTFTTSIQIDGDLVSLTEVMHRTIAYVTAVVAYVSELTDTLAPLDAAEL